MTDQTIDYAAFKLDSKLIPLLALKTGAHKSRSDGMCVMEAAAFIAGQPHSDNPPCVCVVIGPFARRTNDRFGQMYRDGLRDRLMQIVGSSATPKVEGLRRGEMLYRTFARIVPLAFDAAALVPRNAPFKDRLLIHSAELRALTREGGISSWRATAQRARATALETRRAAAAYAKKIRADVEAESLATLDAMLAIKETV